MKVTAAAVLVAVVVLGGAAATALAAQHPDVSGQWTLNAAQSDNPRDMLQGRDSTGDESRGGRPGGGYPGMGGGRGGLGGRGGFGRGRPGGERAGMSDEQRQRMRQTMQLVFDAPSVLRIAETDSSVSFASGSGEALLLSASGRKVTQKVDGGGDVEITGRWQGNDFVVERKVSGGGKVTEDYLRSQDGKQLFVIVKSEGRRGRSIEFRRMYDRAPTTQ
jgi:hypothetical protein